MDWLLAVETFALAAATVALAWFTRQLVREGAATRALNQQMVNEMEESRSHSVRPRLALDIQVLGGKAGELLIRNVGRGQRLTSIS